MCNFLVRLDILSTDGHDVTVVVCEQISQVHLYITPVKPAFFNSGFGSSVLQPQFGQIYFKLITLALIVDTHE